MRSARLFTALALSAGALATSAATAPAASATTEGPTSLTLELFHHESGNADTVTLTCNPTGGTHPDAAAACADLNAAGGNVGSIPPQDGPCPRIFAPVTAAANGVSEGAAFNFTQDFDNSCLANRATGGHVFNFSTEQ